MELLWRGVGGFDAEGSQVFVYIGQLHDAIDPIVPAHEDILWQPLRSLPSQGFMTREGFTYRR